MTGHQRRILRLALLLVAYVALQLFSARWVRYGDVWDLGTAVLLLCACCVMAWQLLRFR